jgi:hypothetical protein
MYGFLLVIYLLCPTMLKCKIQWINGFEEAIVKVAIQTIILNKIRHLTIFIHDASAKEKI